DPAGNVHFRSPEGKDYATADGFILRRAHLGIGAPEEPTDPYEVVLETHYEFDVKDPVVRFDENEENAFEISKTSSPFNAQAELSFPGTYPTGTEIGRFFIRCNPKTDKAGKVSFRLEVEAQGLS